MKFFKEATVQNIHTTDRTGHGRKKAKKKTKTKTKPG
jgi:hypothetical protein